MNKKATKAEIKYNAMVIFLNAMQCNETIVYVKDTNKHYYFQSERFEDNTYLIEMKFKGHWVFNKFGTLEETLPKLAPLVKEWIDRIHRTSNDSTALLQSLLNILN